MGRLEFLPVAYEAAHRKSLLGLLALGSPEHLRAHAGTYVQTQGPDVLELYFAGQRFGQEMDLPHAAIQRTHAAVAEHISSKDGFVGMVRALLQSHYILPDGIGKTDAYIRQSHGASAEIMLTADEEDEPRARVQVGKLYQADGTPLARTLVWTRVGDGIVRELRLAEITVDDLNRLALDESLYPDDGDYSAVASNAGRVRVPPEIGLPTVDELAIYGQQLDWLSAVSVA